MNRIDTRFELLKQNKRMLLAPFVTVGYPNIAISRDLALGYVEAGADMLEVGVPFSDPIADGPTVQAASQIALDGGTRLIDAFDLITDIRAKTDVPILLMGYANPFMRRGFHTNQCSRFFDEIFAGICPNMINGCFCILGYSSW